MSASQETETDFSLDVREWANFDGANHSGTHVSEPREITFFSRDTDRKVKFGSREQLKKYEEPKLNSDLGANQSSYIPKAEEVASVRLIIKALQENGFDITENADVITFRNNLNKIGGSPYNTRDDWEMDCCKIGRTLFLEIIHTPGPEPNEQHKRFMYFGYRFESLCTGCADEPVDANSEFCSISRIRIANQRIIVSSEIDCTTKDPSETEESLKGYVELKTMRAVRNDRELGNMYRHRFPKYWLQSYLAGVRNIVLGLRSDTGELLQVKHLSTRGLPNEAKNYFRETKTKGHWDPFVCVNFIDYALSCIRRACDRHPEATIRVKYDSRKGIMSGRRIDSTDQQLRPGILDAMQS